ncbi:uncharacterized protein F4807DRAFT_37490 [Annulohypoxylon truncatum]|uniref:uncharacterized protein n=1 Tax=Annulohypoxylon truncatum TaxID=327061 RepID=UPI00200772F8|nr:uncharacterized protein F4807DRAFT_37490 [Annulohypoxylon truncatum]KAI1211397.1 hypothetical protein F4807DRAFT_37490 [Annulohypoxylon truncatum]
MCRRILTHYMHHDVRSPMLLDPAAENAPVYANPLHTRFHRCEVSRPLPGQWLLGSPFPTCEYHSCCVLVREVEFCADFHAWVCGTLGMDDDEDIDEHCEPEQCVNFVLEHRHEKLSYFGHPEAYLWNRYPATWREDLLEVENRRRMPWADEELFLEGEKLYTLEQDAKTQFLVYRDLFKVWPKGHDQMQHAQFNVEQAQTLLLEQKENVARLIDWARGNQSQPIRAFTPIWWMRMWALEHGEFRE